jgi:hypothetical protein
MSKGDCSKRCVYLILLDGQLVDNQEEKNLCVSATLPARPACWQAGLREIHFNEQSRLKLQKTGRK